MHELGKEAITQAITGANFGDMIDPFKTVSTQFVKMGMKRKFEDNNPFLSCEDKGFTAEEFSEMETSGSSDVTSLTEPKEEEPDWYTNFAFHSQMECESQRLENYTTSFWNVFPNASNDGIDQDPFLSNVLVEFPSTSS